MRNGTMSECFTLRGWLYALLFLAVVLPVMGACYREPELYDCRTGERYVYRERIVGDVAYVDVLCFETCKPMGLGEAP